MNNILTNKFRVNISVSIFKNARKKIRKKKCIKKDISKI